MAIAIGQKLHITSAGFVIGTTDAIRRHGQKPGKELKIQTTTDDRLSSVGLTTEDEKELQLLTRRVSRADTKPLVMCTLYCVTKKLPALVCTIQSLYPPHDLLQLCQPEKLRNNGNCDWSKVAHNEQGLAQAGHSLNVKPGTEAQFYLKVEDKNCCLALFVTLELLHNSEQKPMFYSSPPLAPNPMLCVVLFLFTERISKSYTQ